MSNFSQNAHAVSDYRGGIKVYVESKDDLYILGQKWFSHYKAEIDFQSAEPQIGKGGGGHEAVRNTVNEERKRGIEAYGIVDRDALLANSNDLFWETDDAKFEIAQPFDKFIYILRRWEIENYLFHPDVLAELIADKKLSFLAPSAEIIAQMILDTEEDLITVTTLSTIGVPTEKSPEHGFGYRESGEILQQKVLEQLGLSAANNEFEQHREKIKNFAENETDPITRWDKLSRLLDGKRVLYRLQMIFNQDGLKDMMPERGALADKTKKLGHIDAELTEFFASILNV